MDFSLRSIFKSFPSSSIPTSQVQSQKSEKSTPFSNPSLKLAQLEKRLSASIQYAHGVTDGINPLTFISDGVVDAFHLKRLPSLNSHEYWKGREDGSKLAMLFDTAGMTGGSGLAGASIQCAATTVGGCLPVAGPGAVGGIAVMGLSAAMMVGHGKNLESAQSQSDISESKKTENISTNNNNESPIITHVDLTDKTRAEIRSLAQEKGLEPFGDPHSPDYPRKWKDPVTREERIRLDNGHYSKDTHKPFEKKTASENHVHGYEADGKTKIRNPINNDHHFPTKNE
ncbi:MAG: hypothetical protein JNK65_07715 [Deltaproteobacteria bacterium]|nr:hypothetical protein [Deltaproteobacteria bacterium]